MAAAFFYKAGEGQTAESLAGAVLEDELADGHTVQTAAETLLSVSGGAAVPKVLLAVDRCLGNSRSEVWHVALILKRLAAYPEAAVVSRVRVLLEHWTDGTGANRLIDAWLASEPEGEPILEVIDRGAALSTYDLAWSAQRFHDAGQQAAATELAERLLRCRHASREHYERAASVLLKADRPAAVTQLTHLAQQKPPSAWLGVMKHLSLLIRRSNESA